MLVELIIRSLVEGAMKFAILSYLILSIGCTTSGMIKQSERERYQTNKQNYDHLVACMQTCGRVGIKDFNIFTEGWYKSDKIITCKCKDGSGWQINE